MAKRKKAKRARAPSKPSHEINVRLTPDEQRVCREVARLARVDVAALLRVIIALRLAQALPVLGDTPRGFGRD
jgi:hypothetical protein